MVQLIKHPSSQQLATVSTCIIDKGATDISETKFFTSIKEGKINGKPIVLAIETRNFGYIVDSEHNVYRC